MSAHHCKVCGGPLGVWGGEVCSRSCAAKSRWPSRANRGAWRIVDLETGRPYIARGYASEDEARRELDDLLRPYPAGHEWRRRLEVRAWLGRAAKEVAA